MKVCTFNIWSDAPRNSRWGQRRDHVAGVLQQESPHLAGLQEATLPMLRDLQERLPEYRWIGVGREDGLEAGEFTPIFYSTARLILVEHASFWLSSTCQKAGRGWDAMVCRILTWARFRENASGREFVHFNTHFDHLGRRARRESAALLLQKAAEIAADQPLIVTGDLNCREGSTPYRVLTGQMPFTPRDASGITLRDSYHATEQAPAGPRRTYLGLLGLMGLARIDYVFVNPGFRVTTHRVVDPVGKPSDHRPVVVELEFAP